jgi:hypothetical protein
MLQGERCSRSKASFTPTGATPPAHASAKHSHPSAPRSNTKAEQKADLIRQWETEPEWTPDQETAADALDDVLDDAE